jgi:Ca-activated chloride channel family protein
MRRSFVIALLVLVTSSATAAPPSESFKRGAKIAPTLTVVDEKGRTALALAAVDVRAIIRGHLARTIFELTYRNDLDEVVGGDFAFPLPTDAELSDLGLYFNGRLRHGVAVERVQARTAYEEIVHRRVDPALAEWTAGRAFRLSVYPIEPHGTKTIRIAYDQELTSRPYVLDLRYGTTVGRVDVTVDAETQHVDAVGLDLRRQGTAWHASASKSNLDATVTVARNVDDETAIAAWSVEDRLWYASAPVRVGGDAPSLAPASSLVLLWDASGSAARRDDRRVIELLRLLSQRGDRITRVTLVPFHIVVEPARDVSTEALEQTLADLPSAGATNLAAILEAIPALAAQLPQDSRIALVTDGVTSVGDDARVARAAAALTAVRRPVMVVNASPSPNDQLLASIARRTGGWYLDLTAITPESAAEAARHVPTRASIESAWQPLRDVLPTAIITSDDATITVSANSRDRIGQLRFRLGNQRRDLPVRDAVLPEDAGDLVRRAWARARLRELVDNNGGSDAALLEHGRRFNQLTPRTSLLVLETWQDYERYSVPMPPDVRAEKESDEKAAADRWAQLERMKMPSRIESRGVSNEASPGGAAWFIRGTVRAHDGSELPGVTVTIISGAERKDTVTEGHGRYWLTLSRRPASFRLEVALPGFGSVSRTYDRGAASGAVLDASLNPMIMESITVTAGAPAVGTDNSNYVIDGLEAPANVPTKEALADRLVASLAGERAVFIEDEAMATEAAAKRHVTIEQIVTKLRAFSSPADQMRYYVAARSVLGGDKWFHAHAAMAIHETDAALGLRLLTDLVEAYPNDAPLLRIIGRIVEGWGDPALARILFERALAIAPRETQTWRELMLLESRAGDAQSLAELRRRYQAAERDGRFKQIDEQIQSELPRLGQSAIDPRVDPTAQLQVEVMWDSNYSDVDLHVIEPGGEEVYYSHKKSAKGGLLRDDVTEGYGPETYSIPRAAGGEYKVALEYYAADATAVGAETLVHVIAYEYGHRRDLVIVLDGAKDRVAVVTIRGK